MGLFSLFRDFDIVAGLYLAGFKNLYEYALARHNAVACGLAYRAVVMALLADLRDLAQCRAYTPDAQRLLSVGDRQKHIADRAERRLLQQQLLYEVLPFGI